MASAAATIRAGTRADKQTELTLQTYGHCLRIRAANFDLAVKRRFLEQLRDESIRHAFDVMAAGQFTGEQRMFRRFPSP